MRWLGLPLLLLAFPAFAQQPAAPERSSAILGQQIGVLTFQAQQQQDQIQALQEQLTKVKEELRKAKELQKAEPEVKK